MNNNLKDFFSSLDENNNATAFGNLNYSVVAMEGLGLNPNDILSGKAKAKNKDTRIVLGFKGNIDGKISGVFNGRDFLKIFESNNAFTNTHGVIVTEDNQRIGVKILGETTDAGDICYQLSLRNNSDTYNWVNAKYIFAKGNTQMGTRNTSLTLYAFDENPMDTPLAWEDPDVSKVDYKNFPYTLEDLKNDASATIIYAGDGFSNGVDPLGADVMKVFTGQFPIPEEGLRMNAYFSGPTAGNVNGVISGVNYLRVMPDGSMRMNSKILANTFEGDTILLEALGASFRETGSAWWETTLAASNLEKYDFLTCLHNLGIGSTDVMKGNINYNHYGFKDTKLENQQ